MNIIDGLIDWIGRLASVMESFCVAAVLPSVLLLFALHGVWWLSVSVFLRLNSRIPASAFSNGNRGKGL